LLTILGLSLFVITFFIFLGGPISLVILKKLNISNSINFITFLSFSILIGFGLSGLISSWAYGIFGINQYPLMSITAAVLMWLFVMLKYRNYTFDSLKINKSDSLILIPILLVIYLAKTQWSGLFKPRIYSGYGPDVIQNLMAAQSANSIGATWGQASNNLAQILGTSNMYQAAVDLFQVPNFHDIAGFDYLVFGGRWGLTIPYSQVLKLFGPQVILWETGFVLVVSLICISMIAYTAVRITTNSNATACISALILISNSALLYQYFNGGLSQVFGLIGIFGILLSLILVVNNHNIHSSAESHRLNVGIFVISLFSWVGSSATYLDQTLILILLILVFIMMLLFKNRFLAKDIFKNIFLAGLFAVILNPFFVRAFFSNLEFRILANSGTGVSSGFWKPPSQYWGVFDVFNFTGGKQPILILFISILISISTIIYLTFSLFKKDKDHNFSFLGLAALSVTFIGFLLSINSNGRSDYIYSKVSLYMAPFVIISLILVLLKSSATKISKSILYTLLIITVVSSISSENTFSKNPEVTIVPYEYSDVLKNNEIKQYLLSNNYLMPYKPSYSFAGLFGAEYWVSKAPNDMNLNSRLSNELRLFCFQGDPNCKPPTDPIANPLLQKYGMLEFKSKLTSEEFYKLSIVEKFNYNFDSFGMVREVVPQKFLGGNPYLK
jgi:hypothetical protein